jgi:hypothetical protein
LFNEDGGCSELSERHARSLTSLAPGSEDPGPRIRLRNGRRPGL